MKRMSLLLIIVAMLIITTVYAVDSNAATLEAIPFDVGQTVCGDKVVTKNKQYNLADGVTENEFICNSSTFSRQNMGFFFTIDIADNDNGIKIAAECDSDDGSSYNLSTVTDQAAAYEKKHPGETVVAGINADFYNMQTGEPRGALVVDGKVLKKGEGNNFFAILKDGTAVICNRNGIIQNGPRKGGSVNYKRDISQAVGGDLILAKNGKLTDVATSEYASLSYSRATIGIKKDGSVVTYVTRGNVAPVSYGETYESTANKLLAVGCTTVLALDGGGSATSASKRQGETELTVRNYPSDGAPRQVSSSLLIVSTKDDGNNEHQPLEKHVHELTYNPDTKISSCKTCDSSSSELVGFAKDLKNREYYLGNGIPVTGWKAIDEGIYYFDKNGVMQEISVQKEKKLECTSNGYKIYYCDKATAEDGKTFRVSASLNSPGHDYDSDYVCKTCGWKAVALEDCNISTRYNRYLYTGSELKPYVTVTYNGKVLNSYYDYRVTYDNNTEIGTAAISIDPNIRHYVDLTEIRSSILPGEIIKKEFVIAPKSVGTLRAVTSGCNAIKLSWSRSNSADGYRIYKYSSVKKDYYLYKDMNSSCSSCFVKDLKAGDSYGFKVNSYALDNEGNKIFSASKYVKCSTKPYVVEYVRLKSAVKAINVSWKKRECSGYQVRYSSNSRFSSYNTVNVAGSNNINKKIKGLKSGRRYYVKVRAYRSLSGTPTIYGNWSTVKYVKVK